MGAALAPAAHGQQSDRCNRQWRLRKRPTGIIDDDTFELVETDVPVPGEGEFCVRLVFLSLAPVMRAYILDGGVIEDPLPIGAVMRGRGVGEVIASRHPEYDIGDILHGPFGWQEYAISDGSGRVIKMAGRASSTRSFPARRSSLCGANLSMTSCKPPLPCVATVKPAADAAAAVAPPTQCTGMV